MSITIPTDMETRRFIVALQKKMAQVSIAYERRGKSLLALATPAVRKAVSAVAVLQRRHASGDISHTTAEEQALKDVSKWLVEAWHRLHGTEVPKTTWIKGE